MALFIAWFILITLVSLALMQTGYVIWFGKFLFQAQPEDEEQTTEASKDSLSAQVALVLCLRGEDPSLFDCLTGIQAQEYENFQLLIIVDDLADPAVEAVNEFFNDPTRTFVSLPNIYAISNRRDTCSLKCSAILEALQHLPEQTEIVAMIDADTAPDENWLRDLVEPFSDSSVGATTGNRWFAPSQPTFGSYVRQVWNAAAVVQMDIYNIAWGGTLAIRKSVIESSGLKDKWSKAFCEDTMLTSVLESNQLELVRVPNLICENTETTTVTSAYRWILRQLLTVRLHNPKWPLVYMHGIATAFAVVAPLVACVCFYVMGIEAASLLVLLAMTGYQMLNWILVKIIMTMHTRVLKSRGGFNLQSFDEGKQDNPIQQILACFLIQFLYPLACVSAARAKSVSWRGIEYAIDEQNQIKLLGYRPYRNLSESDPTETQAPTEPKEDPSSID